MGGHGGRRVDEAHHVTCACVVYVPLGKLRARSLIARSGLPFIFLDVSIAAAVDVLKNRKIARGVEFYIAAANSLVQWEAEELGHRDTFVSAGAKVLQSCMRLNSCHF